MTLRLVLKCKTLTGQDVLFRFHSTAPASTVELSRIVIIKGLNCKILLERPVDKSYKHVNRFFFNLMTTTYQRLLEKHCENMCAKRCQVHVLLSLETLKFSHILAMFLLSH